MNTHKLLPFLSARSRPFRSLASASFLLIGCSAPADPAATGGAATGGASSGGGTAGTGGSVGSGGAAGGAGGEAPCDPEFTLAELTDPAICETGRFTKVARFRHGSECEGVTFTLNYAGISGSTTLQFTEDGRFIRRTDAFDGFAQRCSSDVPQIPLSPSCDDQDCVVCRTEEGSTTDLPLCDE